MGDRTTVYYTLGGKVSAANLFAYARLAHKNNVFSEDQTILETPEQVMGKVLQGHHLTFLDANYAEVPEIENFLFENKLTYLCEWEPGHDYAARASWFRDGIIYHQTDRIDGEPAIALRDLQKLIENDGLADWIEKSNAEIPTLELV